eukprot:6176908-Pleurochrysis_carterae.AAC.1
MWKWTLMLVRYESGRGRFRWRCEIDCASALLVTTNRIHLLFANVCEAGCACCESMEPAAQCTDVSLRWQEAQAPSLVGGGGVAASLGVMVIVDSSIDSCVVDATNVFEPTAVSARALTTRIAQGGD